MKKFLKFLFIIVFLLTLASCGSTKSEYNHSDSSIYNDGLVYSSDRKIIYKVNYNYSAKNIKDEIKDIRNYVISESGYIESSYEDKKYAYYIYRIPTDKLNDFMKYIDEKTGYKDMNVSTTDVTTSYNYVGDILTDLSNRKTKYEQMLENNDLTYDEILQIENQIDKIRNEIADYESRVISQQEDLEYAKVTINYRIKTNPFLDFLVSVALYVGIVTIIFIPFGTVGLIIFLIFRKKKNKLEEA